MSNQVLIGLSGNLDRCLELGRRHFVVVALETVCRHQPGLGVVALRHPPISPLTGAAPIAVASSASVRSCIARSSSGRNRSLVSPPQSTNQVSTRESSSWVIAWSPR